jgi:hypothetical protein
VQRAALVSVTRSEAPAFDKLGAYVHTIQKALGLDFCGLYIFSKHHWLQVCLKAPRVSGGPPKLSQAHVIPSYSASHQLAEIVRDDPTAVWTDYATSGDLPGDLRDIADREVPALLPSAPDPVLDSHVENVQPVVSCAS